MLHEWVGKRVIVVLRDYFESVLAGKLLQTETSGILVELPDGLTYIPSTSVLHVRLEA